MKTAMVWGASGGIGRALVQALTEEGWSVIGLSRDLVADAPKQRRSLTADVSKPWEVEQAVFETAMEAENVDLWVYSIGDILSEKVAQLNPDSWARIIDANLTGAYSAAHYSLPLLSESATLVFIGAVSERLKLPGLSAYVAAKAGLEAFVAAFSKEERKKRMILVRPGAVDTQLWEKVPLKLPANAPPPEKVARRIIEAVNSDHKGQLDLV